MAGIGILGTLILMAVAMVVLGLTIAYVLVPLFKGIGWTIAGLFRAIAWLLVHIVEFIGGMISDVLRFVGAVIATVVLMPFVPLNVVLGRWSATGHFAESIKRECKVAGACLYRVVLRRPLKLFWLHGILEGVEQRLPEAMAAAPAADRPSRRAGQFDGYTIVGSLPGGGSGAKLYIAEPTPDARSRNRGLPDRVVIKAFALTEGSSLPQIVRESRALECAKQLGLVLDHGMDDHRFFYIMPYHPGEHMGVLTRQLHGQSDGRGLGEPAIRTVIGYTADLLETLAGYHRGGLWHKDVKPENVIVHSGHAHLVDLGLVTPLRSAMTLTTHGTEYFRDPEMVRQALRGVKVHQVDGTKFDIYAVGAVLYYVIENTFPAHGGLSRFTKKSPEALRWIVRRAMADYNQRYESADAMLADLQVVAAAPDTWAVKPVDLPSMRGGAVPAPSETLADASMPPPLPVILGPVAAGPGPGPVPETVASRRAPRLRVTNWWTGEYAVDDPGHGTASVSPPLGDRSRELREQARQFQSQAQQFQHQVQSGAMNARRAAREQIKAARARARDLRKRAKVVRHHAVAERQPGPMVFAVIAVFLLIGAALVVALARNVSSSRQMTIVSHTLPVMEDTVPEAEVEAPRVMLVVDAERPLGAEAWEQIKPVMRELREDGYDVLLPQTSSINDHTAHLLQAWNADQDGPADDELEDLMADMTISGVEWITVNWDADGDVSIDPVLIRSTRPDVIAQNSDAVIATVVNSAAPRLLLVNDHPAKFHPEVEREVETAVDAYRRRQWDVLVDDDAEAAVRQALPSGPIDETAPIPPRLYRVLQELGLAGVLRVGVASGEGAPHERVMITRIDALPAEVSDEGEVGSGAAYSRWGR